MQSSNLDRYTSSAYRAQRKAVFANIEATQANERIKRLEDEMLSLKAEIERLTGNGNPKN